MAYSSNKRDAVAVLTLFLLVTLLWKSFMTSVHVPSRGDVVELRPAKDHVTVNERIDGEVGCSDYRFMPPGTFPNVALASVQGSGNTWVRWLLQSSTGFAAASVYDEPRTQGFRHEKCQPCNGTALVVKTHIGIQEPIDGAIIIIRNPYSALIAEFNRRKSARDHVGFAPIELFSSPTWERFIHSLMERFVTLPERYIKEGKPVHVVFYEDLKRDTERELRKMLNFLKVDYHEKRLACTLSDAEGASHRRPSTHETFDPFTPEQRSSVDDVIRRMNTLLKDNDLSGLPDEYWIYPGPFQR